MEGYEGAEKTLRLIFACPTFATEDEVSTESSSESSGDENDGFESTTPLLTSLSDAPPSLLDVPQSVWETVLVRAGCAIVSEARGERYVAYVLSESSLFVTQTEVMVKTCGTSHLLALVGPLLSAVPPLLALESVVYGHKAFADPDAQPEAYADPEFGPELALLDAGLVEAGVGRPDSHGAWHFAGSNVPVPDAYWAHVAAWECGGGREHRASKASQASHLGWGERIEFMVVGADPSPMLGDAGSVLAGMGAKLMADAMGGEACVDSHAFHPQGHSFNVCVEAQGRDGVLYATGHLTPDLPAPYLSYETNHMDRGHASAVLSYLLSVFSPESIVVVVAQHAAHPSGDPEGLLGSEVFWLGHPCLSGYLVHPSVPTAVVSPALSKASVASTTSSTPIISTFHILPRATPLPTPAL